MLVRRGAGLSDAPGEVADAVGLSQALWDARRRRDALLGAASPLFGEPAWDILLQLSWARGPGAPLPVSIACYGTNASLSTGLRYLSRLEEAGLVERLGSTTDRRLSLVRLSDDGERMMDRLVGAYRRR